MDHEQQRQRKEVLSESELASLLASPGDAHLLKSTAPSVDLAGEWNALDSADKPQEADCSEQELAEQSPMAASVPTLRSTDSETDGGESAPRISEHHPRQLAYSTLLSLLVVLVLIVAIRFTVPPLVESLRYSWYRGQLRAEYEASSERLQQVALNSLSDVSQLVSRRAGPSVVHINLMARSSKEQEALERQIQNGLPRALLERNRPQLVGQGSGVVLDVQGHILTNQHVVDGAGKIEVSLSDGRRTAAELIGTDPLTDLAVIRVSAEGLIPITWGNSDQVEVGSPVWAVGSPFGLERTVTFGILSGKHRIDLKGTRYESRVTSTTTYGDLMQSDVAVNPGNSGGPLVNSAGDVIGINTAIVGENYMGVSFSIPSNVARRVAESLVKEGSVARGWMGVKLTTSDIEDDEGNSRRAALVQAWAEDQSSPAKDAGIRPGDYIISFNSVDVTSDSSLRALIAATPIGSRVKVGVVRKGEKLTFDVEIGRRPAD